MSQMSSRMQSASVPAVDDRVGNRSRCQARGMDAGELLLAELAARRARLHELLGLIQAEVAREQATLAPPRVACRRVTNSRLRAAN